MPRKKLNQLKQIDGKIHAEENDDSPLKETKFEPTTIQQILGDTGLQRYKTLDKDVYINQLGEMNLADLRNHATKVGIIPRDISTERLKKQLMAEFLRYVAGYQKPFVKSRFVKPTDEALKIMSAVK